MKATSALVLGAFLFAAPAVFAATGDYQEISCSSQPFFAANDCSQCFQGDTLSAGQKITGLYDSWTNSNQTEQVAYQDEQELPSLVNLGGAGTSFIGNPTDPSKFWGFGSEIIFTPDTGSSATPASASGSASGATAARQVYSLKPGATVRLYDSEFGAYYAVEKTDKKDGEYIAMMKFPVNYRDVSDLTGKPGTLNKHVECVAYQVAAAAAPTVPATAPVGVTKVKTGAADTFLFVGLAMLLSLAFMFARQRRPN